MHGAVGGVENFVVLETDLECGLRGLLPALAWLDDGLLVAHLHDGLPEVEKLSCALYNCVQWDSICVDTLCRPAGYRSCVRRLKRPEACRQIPGRRFSQSKSIRPATSTSSQPCTTTICAALRQPDSGRQKDTLHGYKICLMHWHLITTPTCFEPRSAGYDLCGACPVCTASSCLAQYPISWKGVEEARQPDLPCRSRVAGLADVLTGD